MIDRDQAIDVARKRSQEKNWVFAEPLNVVYLKGWFGKPGCYEIETNAGNRGTKALFTIDAATGEIDSEGYIPR
jgi:Peptidase propeptide and YPEB domain